MLIFPAIDMIAGRAVRLLRGDYGQMTQYNEDPVQVAKDMAARGAGQIHLVDLDGARTGNMGNLAVAARIKKETGLFCEIGGGIRSLSDMVACFAAGMDRVILGTAAVEKEDLLQQAVALYGDRLAVGVDLRDGLVSTHGWTRTEDIGGEAYCRRMEEMGVGTLICTDVSKDGAMQGVNLEMYRRLSRCFRGRILAAGGVTSLEDVKALRELDLYGAIIGKAYYTGAVDLAAAIEVAE